MTNEVFSEHIKHIKNYSMDVLIAKNSNYSKGDTDALHNFVAGAAIAGCTPAQAAWGYATKHFVALRDKIQRNDFSDFADLEEKCCDITLQSSTQSELRKCQSNRTALSELPSMATLIATSTPKIVRKEYSMEVNKYQLLAYTTANKELAPFDQLRNAAYGLNGEAGEVIDILKKHEFQGHNLDTDALVKELGDVAWYLALACTAMGITMSAVLERNIDKLRKRYPEGFDANKSIHREE